MTLDKELANSRIAVTPTTHQRLKDFASGLNTSHDEAINILLDFVINQNKTQEKSEELLAGYSLRNVVANKRDSE